MTDLIIQSGKHQGKRITLPDSQVVIGRDETCQIRLDFDDVSRHHCSLRVSPQGLIARDLGSQNGTYLNEERIEKETVIKPGDMLRVGPMKLQLPDEKQEAAANAKQKDASATDDDIVGWLADSVNSEAAGLDGTTLPEKKPGSKLSGTKDSARREFRSVAEEAADIIRRHWEMQTEEQED